MTDAIGATTAVPNYYDLPTPNAAQQTGIHATPAGEARAPKQEMDKETFLTLLVAQLRYQDPTAPMDTSQMMAQTTQLATMEQLTAMSETARESFALQMRSAAAALVGAEVTYTDEATGLPRAGVVSNVSYRGPVPMLMIGDQEIALDAVTIVTAATRPTAPEPAPTSDQLDPTPPNSATTGETDA